MKIDKDKVIKILVEQDNNKEELKTFCTENTYLMLFFFMLGLRKTDALGTSIDLAKAFILGYKIGQDEIIEKSLEQIKER